MVKNNLLSWNNLRWYELDEDTTGVIGRDLCVNTGEEHQRGPIAGLAVRAVGLGYIVRVTCTWVLHWRGSSDQTVHQAQLMTGGACTFELLVPDLSTGTFVEQIENGQTFRGLDRGTSRILAVGDNIAHPDRT